MLTEGRRTNQFIFWPNTQKCRSVYMSSTKIKYKRQTNTKCVFAETPFHKYQNAKRLDFDTLKVFSQRICCSQDPRSSINFSPAWSSLVWFPNSTPSLNSYQVNIFTKIKHNLKNPNQRNHDHLHGWSEKLGFSLGQCVSVKS